MTVCFLLLCQYMGVISVKAETTPGGDITKQRSEALEANAKKTQRQLTKGESLGLDPFTLKLVNQGNFARVIDRLQLRTQGLSAPNRESAWLAFSYLYLGQCEKLKTLSLSCKNASGDDLNGTLINVFSLVCDKKTGEAEKLLQQISAVSMNDGFVNFAFATVAGKQGKAAIAVTYVQRATELAPKFAWGYRTMAFLQQKSLNAPADAESSYLKALKIEPDLSEALNAVVDLKLAHNDFDGAIAVAQSAIKSNPHSAANHYLLAQIYQHQWRLLESAAQLERAITLDPKNAKYYRSRAALLRYQGKLAEAIVDQEKVVDLDIDKTPDLIDLAAMEAAVGEVDKAVGHLKKALLIDGANKQANDQLVKLLASQGKFEELSLELKQLVAKNPKDESLRMRLADALLANNKTDEAIEQYKEASNLNGNDPEPHRKIAAIYIAQKNFKSAAASYTRALNINSNSVPDLVELGFCYEQTDDYLQAEAALVTALALHQLTQPTDSQVPPTRLDIIRSLATLLFQEGRYADAAAQFVTVCALSKGTSSESIDAFALAQASALRDLSNAGFKNLKAAFEKLSPTEQKQLSISYIDTLIRLKRLDEAANVLSQLDAKKEKSPLLAICWARIWRERGDLAKAEDAAQQAVDLPAQADAPMSDALCELGEVFLAKGKLDSAAQKANRALEINGKSFYAYALLAEIAVKHGDHKMAIEAASKALEIDPYFAHAYILLGDAQCAGKDFTAALGSYHKAVDLYPGLLEAHKSLALVLRKLASADELKKEEAAINQLESIQ